MRLALIRPAAGVAVIKPNTYNIQELGLAKNLTRFGIEVDIFLASTAKNLKIDEFIKDDKLIRIFWLPHLTLPGRQGIYKDLISLLKKGNYDVIQTLDDSQITSVIVAWYGKKAGIPVVLWQGMYEDYNNFVKKYLQKIYDFYFLKKLFSNIDLALCKTNAAAQYLSSKGYFKTIMCPVGLDISNFRIKENSIINWRNKLGLPENSKLLLYVGAIERRRNPDFLIKLANEINKSTDNVYLVMVGKGPLLKKCQDMATKLAIKDKVIFINRILQSDLAWLFKQSDCFLLASNYEIFGMVMLESMFFGLPVISLRTAGTETVIENGKDGYVLDCLNIIKWKEKTMVMLFNEQNRALFGKLAKEKIKKDYLWENIALKYAKIYTDICNKSLEANNGGYNCSNL